jgi:hypothetical protein
VNQEMFEKLRAPFTRKQIGKLPKVYCGDCRERNKVCSEHKKQKCNTCKAVISPAHLHVDFVGHADVTDRLLSVDPGWNWEPLGFDSFGSPAFDGNGGLWIKLTVGGVTRLGYGHADGKKGGDAVKEAIGDAIRNAAMRFGVALDLWRKEKDESAAPEDVPSREVERPAQTVDERKAELRKQIITVSKRRGRHKIEEIEDDFTAWSGPQKLQIQTASVADLSRYLTHIQSGEAGAS